MNQPIPIPHPERIERKVQRVRRYDKNGNMTDLVSVLRGEKFTGTVALHFSEGGILAVTVEDSHRIAGEHSLDIQRD